MAYSLHLPPQKKHFILILAINHLFISWFPKKIKLLLLEDGAYLSAFES